MRILFILVFTLIFQNNVFAGNVTEEIRQSYIQRAEFVKNYISTIKENKKKDKKFRGTIVEAVDGRLYTRMGVLPQNELD
ncbi:hypothetical protein OAS72_01760, partial [Candidatus Pelagibacter sp.]|nr:hypothetical protein [Candidatus Pelagibacter sp.]